MQSRKSFLIIDLDECAFTLDSNRSDMLSQELLDFIETKNYDGFYVCTHRCAISPYPEYKDKKFLAKILRNTPYTPEEVLKNQTTSQIIYNFEKATRLRCQAVSTLDDILHTEAGAAYSLAQIGELHTSQTIDFRRLKAEGKSKNHQLVQIAIHAGENVLLDYIDDNKDLCRKTTFIETHKAWPKGTKLTAHHYNHDNQILKVKPPTTFLAASKAVLFAIRLSNTIETRLTPKDTYGM